MRRLHVITPATAKPQAAGEFRDLAQWEFALKILIAGSLLLVLSAGPSFAQLAPLTPTAPAMGATSPLGLPGTTSPVGAVGIPLGATELSPGGVSPMPLDPTVSADPCLGGGLSASGMSGTVSTFDGSGVATNTIGTSASSCGGTASGTTTTTAGLGGSNGGAAPGVAPVGSIPLDATELNNGGISPLVTTSPALTSPCTTNFVGSTMSPLGSSSPGATSIASSSC